MNQKFISIINWLEAFATSFKLLFLLLSLVLVSSCDDNLLIYAGKQGIKQGGLIIRAKPVEKLINDPNTPEKTKHYLRLSQEILSYAKKNLRMKVSDSYQNFIFLKRNWVTQIVVAAHKDSLTPYYFKFPIVGEVPYKGFFEEKDAIQEQKKLETKGLDVFRRGAPAYSSLGWFSDPLYNTMFTSEAYLVELLLHELVHLNFYFKSHADFNEAFATWFASNTAADFVKQSKVIKNKQKVLEELKRSETNDKIYSEFSVKAIDLAKQAYSNKQNRAEIFNKISELAKTYPTLKTLHKRKWNNAVILSLSTYYQQIPLIEVYAQKKAMSPSQLLHHIIKTEEKILTEL